MEVKEKKRINKHIEEDKSINSVSTIDEMIEQKLFN